MKTDLWAVLTLLVLPVSGAILVAIVLLVIEACSGGAL
jgi:hypothetical protein